MRMLSESVPAGGMRVRLWQPHFVFAVLAQFLYVGAQVGTWSYFILYVRSATGVGDKVAGYMLTGTLIAFAVGRFSSAWLMKHFHARLMLVVYSVANVALCLAAVVHPSWLGVGCLLMTSLFMSIMFPTIFALGLKGMGEKTKTAGSFLVMAISRRVGADQSDGDVMAFTRPPGRVPSPSRLLRRGCSLCVAVRRGKGRRSVGMSGWRHSKSADERVGERVLRCFEQIAAREIGVVGARVVLVNAGAISGESYFPDRSCCEDALIE